MKRRAPLRRCVSDERGNYRTEGLAAGRYRIETTLSGFEPVIRQVALASGQTTRWS